MMPYTKILFFLPNLGGGGTERVALNLSREFGRRGVDVRFVILEDRIELDVDTSKVFRLPVRRPARLIQSPIYWYGSVRFLARLVAQESPDALVSFMTGPNYMAAIASYFAPIRRLILSERVVASMNLKGKTLWLVGISIGRVYRRADRVIAVSEATASDLESLGVAPGLIELIHNPVDLDGIRGLGDEPIGELERAYSRPVVCAVGRLEEQKGYPHLLRAFGMIRETDTNLVIVGKGSAEAELKRLAADLGVEDRVFFAGFQTNPYKFIKKARVLALSSLWEGLPNVLIEALTLGTAVVATDCSGVAEILNRGELGLIVPRADPAALAWGLRRVLEESRVFDQRSLLERADDFSMQKIGDRYLETILGVPV